ncbi:hypothetical protein [Pseudonocardia spinosispora]|uniref:hypothetical protein n=1 Tax=Pseudonocardia spinosispora TaxID=103441 RepID=UPI000416302C|nr:hypothetical protein [Pseudonocardia spinosispora]
MRNAEESTTGTLRGLTAFYVLISVPGMLLPPVFPTTDPWRAGYWAAGAVICLGVLVSTVRQPSRPLSLGAGWLVFLLAVYLGFVVADLLAAVTVMPLSVAVLSLLAGQVAPRTRKVLLTLHVALSGVFLGLAAVMLTLAVLAADTRDAAVAQSHYVLLAGFEVTILPWVSLSSIMSGLAVSLTGKWGLVKHYWVLAKFVLAVLAVASGLVFVQGWVASAAEKPGADPVWLIGGFGVGGALVLAATVLSVYKPWGRTRFGRTTPRTPRPHRAMST